MEAGSALAQGLVKGAGRVRPVCDVVTRSGGMVAGNQPASGGAWPRRTHLLGRFGLLPNEVVRPSLDLQ